MLKHLIFAVFSLDRTHANFRQSEMDELYKSGNWVIGSQGNGYGKIRMMSKYFKNITVVPRSYATPNYSIFASMLF